MEEYVSKASEFLRDNLLASICFCIGMILLVSGVMAFSGSSKDDVVFESDTVTQSGSSDVKGVKDERMIVVDISGAVKKPGVYRLAEKSRIEDSIIAAGGLAEEADLGYIAKNVNLASILSDGAKVYLPIVNEGESGSVGMDTSAGSSAGKININTASSGELEALPGIGTVTAGKVISGRPYSAIDDLIKKKIVSKRLFDQIKEKVSVY